MTTPIGLFRAHVTDIDRLIRTTVGRTDMLEDLLEKLRRNAGKKSAQHFLFIGPRGIGKTHFLSLVENAVETRPDLKERYTVVRFPEENNRILCFADVLLEIVRGLVEGENDGSWRDLHQLLSSVQDDQEIADTAIPRLRRYRQQSGRTILLLMENLDSLFGQQIKNEQEVHRLRTFLMDSPCATLVATSPVFFADILNVQKPFYEFFDIQVLEDLSEELTLDLVKRNLETDGRTDLLACFETLMPKIKALHTMTGGNPRLIMMLYELIAFDNILEVKVQFEKLLDKITPFYQDRMKELAPQERALLETMALMRTEPRTPAAIAARLRKPPQQISSLLKRMIQAGYLTVSENPLDKRSRIYRIKEGFFDLWLAMSESRSQRKRLGYLVKLFEMWYQDRMDRDEKRSELRLSLAGEGPSLEVREGHASYLGNLSELKPLSPMSQLFLWMSAQAIHSGGQNTDLDVVRWFEGLIEYWKVQRSGDLEKAVQIAQSLGMDLSERGLHKVRIELLKDALSHACRAEDQIDLHQQMAWNRKMDGQLAPALQSLQAALELCQKINDRQRHGTALNNMAAIYAAKYDYDTALGFLDQCQAMQPEMGGVGSSVMLFNKGYIYYQKKEPALAFQAWKEAFRLAKSMNLALIMNRLKTLAELFRLPDGLDAWERLSPSSEEAAR
jgi:tetratricopeptide (TPR) repeat protein